MVSKEEVLQRAEEYNVKFVRLQFTDLFGVLKNIAITVEDLPRALEGQVLFDSSAVDGILTGGEKDIRLMPDPNTFVIFPWRPREGAVARVICDVINIDGSPYQGCSRSVLQKMLREFAAANLTMLVGAKIEFFMFKVNEAGQPLMIPHDHAGFCDLTPLDLGENARREMVLTLEEMGIEIGSSHHEFAQGQHEIVLKADRAMNLADKIATLRFVVRTIAQRHGLHASFMPKPFQHISGSGMHMHLTLFNDLNNVFNDPRDSNGLSNEAKYFMAGILEHAKGMTAITNPLVNSYKRLVLHQTAPRLRGWSIDNRSTMLRVPGDTAEEKGIDVRTPDGTCNPYLALAVLGTAGLEGIKKQAVLPAPVEYKTSLLAKKPNLLLPDSLKAALEYMAKDKLIRDVLGEHILSNYIDIKDLEWSRFQETVHSWEVTEYLSRF